ncbi:hypothetical protein ACFQFH_04665 [Halobaculum halobium]|uniref:hypothetical protein n=1 Tax=Halobaculum halobium TaxID=3032281 RepID=UPI00360D7481
MGRANSIEVWQRTPTVRPSRAPSTPVFPHSPPSGTSGFRRSIGRFLSSSRRPTPRRGDRTRLLDRAVAAVEGDLRHRAASFAGDLRAPVTGLYAFGVLLPLALVGTLPAAVAAGVSIPAWGFATTYVLVLPAALAVAAGRLLLRRPVALPAPRIDATHPAVPDRRALALLAGATAAVAGWFVAPVVVSGWASPVLAVGVGVGTGAWVHLHPRREVRRTVEERDRG